MFGRIKRIEDRIIELKERYDDLYEMHTKLLAKHNRLMRHLNLQEVAMPSYIEIVDKPKSSID